MTTMKPKIAPPTYWLLTFVYVFLLVLIWPVILLAFLGLTFQWLGEGMVRVYQRMEDWVQDSWYGRQIIDPVSNLLDEPL